MQTQQSLKAGERTQKKAEPIFRLETEHPLAGKGEQHPLREWKRIYGYDGRYFPFPAKFVAVESEPHTTSI